jgi:hypothetical protein
MAHTFTFPILLDGKNVNGFRVQELKTALISLGVPESDHAQTKAVKLFQLKSVLSSTRASQGSFGALEDGRLIDSLSSDDLKSIIAARGGDSSLPPGDGVNLQNCLPSELQRLVRLATGCSPLPIPPLQVDQPRRLRSSVRAAAALAAHPGGLAPPVFGVTGQVPPVFGVTGQVLSPTTATTAAPALPTPLPVTATTVVPPVTPLMPVAAPAPPTPLPDTVTTVVPPVTPLLPSPQPAPPVVPPTVHFDDSTTSFTQHGRSPTLNASPFLIPLCP